MDCIMFYLWLPVTKWNEFPSGYQRHESAILEGVYLWWNWDDTGIGFITVWLLLWLIYFQWSCFNQPSFFSCMIPNYCGKFHKCSEGWYGFQVLTNIKRQTGSKIWNQIILRCKHRICSIADWAQAPGTKLSKLCLAIKSGIGTSP